MAEIEFWVYRHPVKYKEELAELYWIMGIYKVKLMSLCSEVH